MPKYIFKNILQSKILGGFHIISIHDENRTLIFKENSQKPESFRPWFIVNCGEKIDNVEIIGKMFEKEILESLEMDIEFNGKTFGTQLRVFLMMDSKLIDMGTGLGGAFCNCCTASEDQAMNLSNIIKGRVIHKY